MIFGALTRPPRFLTDTEVLSLHESAIQQHGGSTGVRDPNLLGSAIAMAQQGFSGEFAHTVPFGMAAAYAFHICKNHPFVDGNKRTAFAACVTFLFLNGWELVSPDDATAEQIVAIAENRLDKAQCEQWLTSSCRPRPSMELREFFASVDPAKFVDTYNSMRPDAPGNAPAGFHATSEEVASAMPLVIWLGQVNKEAGMAGNDDHRRETAAMILTLCALYRIAETDLGYEW